MFDIFLYPEIINFIKSYSFIFKTNSSKTWIQILCPYCNDRYRKKTITHGHFYISRFYNFCKCFRCEARTTINDFLIDINYPYTIPDLFKVKVKYIKDEYTIKNNEYDLTSKIKNITKDQFKIFKSYVMFRLGIVDYLFFKIYPIIINNNLAVGFDNYYNNFVTARFINPINNFRYYKEKSEYYFFQEPMKYNNIVLTEGIFDCINIYKYCTLFDRKNTFYIAINGNNYSNCIYDIIRNYYMIGDYTFNIILDKDVNFKIKLNNKLNPNIIYNQFKPKYSKDFSEFALLEKI